MAGTVALREAVDRAKPFRDAVPGRPLRAFKVRKPPPEPGVSVDGPWTGQANWVADLAGPVRDTDADPAKDAVAVRRSAACLRELGLAAVERLSDTGDWPVDLTDLLAHAPAVEPGHVFSPRLESDAAVRFGKGDRDRLTDWAARHADYVYHPPPGSSLWRATGFC